MSFSNPKITNPAVKFIEWSGEKGKFYYYNKEKQVKEFIELPIFFIVLDELTTVTGYNQKSGSGIYSNEVRDVRNDVLHVKSFRVGVSENGVWSDIKDALSNEGGKYAKSVYALMISEKGNEMVNFKFYGSSFSGTDSNKSNKAGWINAKFNKEQYGVQVKNILEGINGNREFRAPVFEPVKVMDKEPLVDAAKKADIELQQYFEYYFKQPVKEIETNEDVLEDMNEKQPPPFPEAIQEEKEDEIGDLPWD